MSKPEANKSSFVKWAFGLGGALLALIGALFGVEAYLENKINNAIQSEKVVKKIQSYVRPSIIFDQNGSLLSDQGAWQFIDDLQVFTNKQEFVEKIVITLKQHTASPILTSLDTTVEYYISTVRGKKLDIIYEVEMRSYLEPRAPTSLFNLEIVSGETLQLQKQIKGKERVMYFPGTIIADVVDIIDKPGQSRMNISMREKPTFSPLEGDTYYDLRTSHYRVFSQGRWRKLLFADENKKSTP